MQQGSPNAMATGKRRLFDEVPTHVPGAIPFADRGHGFDSALLLSEAGLELKDYVLSVRYAGQRLRGGGGVHLACLECAKRGTRRLRRGRPLFLRHRVPKEGGSRI